MLKNRTLPQVSSWRSKRSWQMGLRLDELRGLGNRLRLEQLHSFLETHHAPPKIRSKVRSQIRSPDTLCGRNMVAR